MLACFTVIKFASYIEIKLTLIGSETKINKVAFKKTLEQFIKHWQKWQINKKEIIECLVEIPAMHAGHAPEERVLWGIIPVIIPYRTIPYYTISYHTIPTYYSKWMCLFTGKVTSNACFVWPDPLSTKLDFCWKPTTKN